MQGKGAFAQGVAAMDLSTVLTELVSSPPFLLVLGVVVWELGLGRHSVRRSGWFGKSSRVNQPRPKKRRAIVGGSHSIPLHWRSRRFWVDPRDVLGKLGEDRGCPVSELRILLTGTDRLSFKGLKLRGSTAWSIPPGWVNVSQVKTDSVVRIAYRTTVHSPDSRYGYLLIQPSLRYGGTLEFEILPEYSVARCLKTVKKPTPNVVKVYKTDIKARWIKWTRTSTIEDSIAELALVLQWYDRAIQRTLAERKHVFQSKPIPEAVRSRLGKVKKLRMRAGYDTTPGPERETCLRMAIRSLETLVAPEFLPSIGSAEYIARRDGTSGRSGISPLPHIRTRPASRTGPRGVSGSPSGPSSVRTGYAGGGRQSDEVKPIADAIAAILGSGTSIRQAPIRISLRTPIWNGTLFYVFAQKTAVHLVCPVFQHFGAHLKDNVGVPKFVFRKPINSNMILEIEGWVHKVVNYLNNH